MARFDVFGRGRWRRRSFVASRSYRNGIANDRATHSVLAYVRVLEGRCGAPLPLEFDPNVRLLFPCQRKAHLQVGIAAMVEGNGHGASPDGIARENPGTG